jgi:hypothetical protein
MLTQSLKIFTRRSAWSNAGVSVWENFWEGLGLEFEGFLGVGWKFELNFWGDLGGFGIKFG